MAQNAILAVIQPPKNPKAREIPACRPLIVRRMVVDPEESA
jgi:hypothetical protein